MSRGITPRMNMDEVFQDQEMKNPLFRGLSVVLSSDTLSSLAFLLVGTRGFEPRTPTVSG